MSGGRFLKSLLKSFHWMHVRNLLKEDYNFWEEIISKTFKKSALAEIIYTDFMGQFSEDSMKIAITITGFIP